MIPNNQPFTGGVQNDLMMSRLSSIDSFLYNDFIFSPRFRIWRHVIYWSFHITIWTVFWIVMGAPTSFWRILFNMALWIPVFILYSYPLAYGAIPHLLLKGKVVQFFLLIMAWGVLGLFINSGFRTYLYVPLQVAMGFEFVPEKGPQPHSYLCMTTSAASPMIIKFFKLWTIRQKDWMQAQQEKITAELQLLKAQVHPHFLFNTLNNIYSFSMDNSPKTPGLILKLSSLLSYMLYDCKADKVRLEKEIEIMKNYIDLEKERSGNKIEISWNIEGNIKDKFISPLMMLPFLENAFKHGISEQIGNPWLSVDISVKSDILRCKIVNSKDDCVSRNSNGNGIGIYNVKKRLALIYSDHYELKMHDEGNFFVVSLILNLMGYKNNSLPLSPMITQTIPA
jgi:two-component system, LytTR family, sensor histidine kinase AlgZ